MEDDDRQYIVITGNPFDGMIAHGPFEDTESAEEWAEGPNDDTEWWLVPVEPVEGE